MFVLHQGLEVLRQEGHCDNQGISIFNKEGGLQLQSFSHDRFFFFLHPIEL